MNLPRSLVLLVLAAILPLAIFASALGVNALHQQRLNMERDAIARTDKVAALVDRELVAQTRVLQAVSASPLLTEAPLNTAAVEAYFRQVMVGQPAWRRIYLSNTDLQSVAVSARVQMQEPGQILERESYITALRTGRPVIGSMSFRRDARAAFPIRVPVVKDGRVVNVLSAAVEPIVIGRLLAQAELPPDWLGAVVDRHGVFAARNKDSVNRVGRPGSQALRDAAVRGGSGVYRGVSLEGEPIVTAYKTLPDSGWSVHIAMPQKYYTASFDRSLWLIGGGGALVLGAAAIFLWVLLREMQSRNRRDLAQQESQRLEALGRITGGVAHDFNNLLMIVHGGAEAIERNLGKPERVKTYVDAILSAADRGKSLTRQLLAFGRRSSHEPVSFRLQDRLDELRGLLEKSTRPDITTSVFVPAEVGAIYADPSALEIAIINLAVNARDAMPERGHLALTAFNARFDKGPDKRTGLTGDYVAVVVADSGTGIPPEALARIFEPFYTTKAPGKGTGLGLSQVYGFAQQSGGAVTVDSTVDEGTSFTLYLPRAREEPAAINPSGKPVTVKGHGKVLVVDDNHDVAMVTQALLRSAGFEVSWAGGGQDALDAIKHGAYDVVVSDILMPGMSGLDLAAR
ncbi:MAG: ATP-binding protein, partial [Caulobacteraceae bacterium]